MKKVTLDDVARVADVSRATASRALNGRPGVRDDVRERVAGVAEHLGFRPDRAAQSLASGRSSIVGLVMPVDDLSRQPFGVAIVQSVFGAAAARGLSLTVDLTADAPAASVDRIVRDGLLDGVIVGTTAFGDWADRLFDSPISTVLIGDHPTRSDVVSVDVGNVEAAALAVTHLIDQGGDRVGSITGPLDRVPGRDRLEGYRLAHERAGRPVDERLVVNGNFLSESGGPAALELIERGVDAIFVANDEMAFGAVRAIQQRGLRVPDDVLIAGFDGLAIGDDADLTITSVVQPFDRIADAAVDLLQLMFDDRPVDSVRFDAELAVRASSVRGTV